MMTYEQARIQMLEIAGDRFFSMAEDVPSRPCKYCKPTYSVSIVDEWGQVRHAKGTSWKKAIGQLQFAMEALAA